ncbi:MAG: GNAT family N-acetyltransferase [Planctomycetes bacterium]|nr:GNAT family N-acetyltransferase [Planctomycetota bacterium]
MPALIEKCASVSAVTNMPNNRDCYVALSGKTLVAFLTIKGDEVSDLFVDTAQHRKGLGAELFRFALQAVKNAGHRQLQLVTTGYGIPFYQAMGMKVTGKVDITSGPLQGGQTTRLEMRLV